MSKIVNHFWAVGSLAVAIGCSAPQAQTPDPVGVRKLTVNAAEVVAEIQPTMYGIFFEDINFAADGGIYAEMIKNRSFEFDDPLMGWEQPGSDRFSKNVTSGFASALNRGENLANMRFLRVNVNAETGYSLTNTGFRGMGVKKDLRYDLTLDVRVLEGSPKLKAELVTKEGQVLGSALVSPAGNEWKNYSVSFTASATEAKALFRISFEGKGIVDLDMISLFPADTWKGRAKGMRADLVQLLADMNPGFLRFPGGCIVEGRNLSQRYQWKKTVGDIADRDVLINRWNVEFAHRPTPDYFQSFGLGFYEYFLLSEDLGAEPLPILGCGMACQFNTGELVPLDELGPYIEDALDLIEFANGPVTSRWGKLRAEMGHPEPFNMKYLGIGNEQWGPQYIERYKIFEAAVKAKYPEMIIVSGSGPFPDGEMFEYGWEELKKLDAEIVDEHFYRNPDWFLKSADRYDSYDRNGPKVFAGEYAAQSVAIASPENKNNWECALSEAAFMTGLERNADVVYMTSYAPLFAHAEGWQWTPDLIWFDNLRSYATPNYHVQQLYGTNPGTHLLKLTEGGEVVKGKDGLYASAVLDKNTNEVIVKVVNATGAAQQVELDVQGVSGLVEKGQLTVLSSPDLKSENSLDNPQVIAPTTSEYATNGNQVKLTATAQSFSVLRIGLKGEVTP